MCKLLNRYIYIVVVAFLVGPSSGMAASCPATLHYANDGTYSYTGLACDSMWGMTPPSEGTVEGPFMAWMLTSNYFSHNYSVEMSIWQWGQLHMTPGLPSAPSLLQGYLDQGSGRFSVWYGSEPACGKNVDYPFASVNAIDANDGDYVCFRYVVYGDPGFAAGSAKTYYGYARVGETGGGGRTFVSGVFETTPDTCVGSDCPDEGAPSVPTNGAHPVPMLRDWSLVLISIILALVVGFRGVGKRPTSRISRR